MPLVAAFTRLAHPTHERVEAVHAPFSQWLLVPKVIELPEAAERLAMLHEFAPLDFPEQVISAETGDGLETLRMAIYRALDVVRVYSTLPKARAADMEKPFTVKRGGTVLDV